MIEHKPVLIALNAVAFAPVVAGLLGHANELAAIASAIYFGVSTYFMIKNNRKK